MDPEPRGRRRYLAIALVMVILGAGYLAIAGADFRATDGDLAEIWLSETGRNVSANHHTAIGARLGDEAIVFAPVSDVPHDHSDGHGHGSTHHANTGCALVGLDGTDGGVRWRYRVPPGNCTIHSVANPTLADVVGDPDPELIATTTERSVAVFDPRSGRVLNRYNLSTYGYTSPIVADVTPAAGRELVVADVHGRVYVVGRDGGRAWTKDLRAFVWGQPAVEDVDGDGANELLVALASGRLVSLDGDGRMRWNRSVADGSSVTWMATGRPTPDAGPDVVIGTVDGTVARYDGVDGARVWRRDLGAYAAVRAVTDGDGDGTAEVYATARDGSVRAIDMAAGNVEWTRSVTDGRVQMMPPPTAGDLDGDGGPELVVPTNDGVVWVLEPGSGRVLAKFSRDVPIWTAATLADLDGTAGSEVLVMYGDGRVAALEYRPP